MSCEAVGEEYRTETCRPWSWSKGLTPDVAYIYRIMDAYQAVWAGSGIARGFGVRARALVAWLFSTAPLSTHMNGIAIPLVGGVPA